MAASVSGDGLARHVDAVNSDHVQTRIRQVLDVVLLVGRAAFRQDLQEGIPDLRLRQCPFGHRAVQAGEMMAVQVPDQVGRAEFEGIPHSLHEIEGYSV